MKSTTLGSLLAQADGRPEGFNYLRLILALLVIASHAPIIVWGTRGYDLM